VTVELLVSLYVLPDVWKQNVIVEPLSQPSVEITCKDLRSFASSMGTPLVRHCQEEKFLPVGAQRDDLESFWQLSTAIALHNDAKLLVGSDHLGVQDVHSVVWLLLSLLFKIACRHLLHDQFCKSLALALGGFFLDG